MNSESTKLWFFFAKFFMKTCHSHFINKKQVYWDCQNFVALLEYIATFFTTKNRRRCGAQFFIVFAQTNMKKIRQTVTHICKISEFKARSCSNFKSQKHKLFLHVKSEINKCFLFWFFGLLTSLSSVSTILVF